LDKLKGGKCVRKRRNRKDEGIENIRAKYIQKGKQFSFLHKEGANMGFRLKKIGLLPT
jgi:hypothetical protein